MPTQINSSLEAQGARLPFPNLIGRGNWATSTFFTVLGFVDAAQENNVNPFRFQPVVTPGTDPVADPATWDMPIIRLMFFLADAPASTFAQSVYPPFQDGLTRFFATGQTSDLIFSRDGVAIDSRVPPATYFSFPPQQGLGFFGGPPTPPFLIGQQPADPANNQDVRGATPTNDVNVQGYLCSMLETPRGLFTPDGAGQIGVPPTPADFAITVGVLSKTDVVEGQSLSQSLAGPENTVHPGITPVVLRESDYTQEMFDAGNVYTAISGGREIQAPIVGLWDSPGNFGGFAG